MIYHQNLRDLDKWFILPISTIDWLATRNKKRMTSVADGAVLRAPDLLRILKVLSLFHFYTTRNKSFVLKNWWPKEKLPKESCIRSYCCPPLANFIFIVSFRIFLSDVFYQKWKVFWQDRSLAPILSIWFLDL